MRTDLWFFATLGLANAKAIVGRQEVQPFRPKTDHPEFFSLLVETSPQCANGGGEITDANTGETTQVDCTFDNYVIRLEGGKVIATPYYPSSRLPIFFVDDDTKLYTVSKQPLQVYVDLVSGELRYGPVGYLPPNAIAISFYKTGNNPLGRVGPSPSYLSWPSTQGITTFAFGDGPWWLCPYGITGQYQVFIANANFAGDNGDDISSDVSKAPNRCQKESLAAINANPFRSSSTSS